MYVIYNANPQIFKINRKICSVFPQYYLKLHYKKDVLVSNQNMVVSHILPQQGTKTAAFSCLCNAVLGWLETGEFSAFANSLQRGR